MLEVIGNTLSDMIVIALSTVPLIGLLILLAAEGGKGKGLAYTLGVVIGIGILTGVFVAIGTAAGASDEAGDPSLWSAILRLVLGAGLIFLGIRTFRGRPRSDEEFTEPKWMSKIDSMKGFVVFGLGALLMAANPKNIAIAVSAGTEIAQGGLSTGLVAVTVVVFTVLATSTFIIPTVLYLVIPDKFGPKMQSMRMWLQRHSAVIMFVLLVVIGMKILGEGLADLRP